MGSLDKLKQDKAELTAMQVSIHFGEHQNSKLHLSMISLSIFSPLIFFMREKAHKVPRGVNMSLIMNQEIVRPEHTYTKWPANNKDLHSKHKRFQIRIKSTAVIHKLIPIDLNILKLKLVGIIMRVCETIALNSREENAQLRILIRRSIQKVTVG